MPDGIDITDLTIELAIEVSLEIGGSDGKAALLRWFHVNEVAVPEWIKLMWRANGL